MSAQGASLGARHSSGAIHDHDRASGLARPQQHSTALDPLVHRLVGEIEERGLTREQVSLDAGLGKDTIGSWARGQRTPNIGNLRAALQVVGCAIDCTPLDCTSFRNPR